MKRLLMMVGLMLAAGMTVAVAGMTAPPNPLPKESKAVEKDGLSLAVRLAKTQWNADEPLEFTIVLKNVSDKPLLLWNAGDCRSYHIVVQLRSDDRGSGWTPEWPTPQTTAPAAGQKSQTLEPGQSLEAPVSLKGPRWQFAAKTKDPVNPIDRLTDDRELRGAGWLTLAVTRDFQANPAAKGNESGRYWQGRIASRELVFQVAGAARAAEGPATRADAGPDETAAARVVLNWPAALTPREGYEYRYYCADVRSQTELDALHQQIASWVKIAVQRPPLKVDFPKERVLVFPIHSFDGNVTVEATRQLPDGTLQAPLVTKAGTRRAIVGIALPATRREICVTRRQDGDKDTRVLLRVPADPADQPFAKVVECRYGFFDDDKYPDRLAGELQWKAGKFSKPSVDNNTPRGARPLDAKGQPFRSLPYHLDRNGQDDKFVEYVFWSRKASAIHLAVKKEQDWWRLDVREEGAPRVDGKAAALKAILKQGQTCLLPKGWMYQLRPLSQAAWRIGAGERNGPEPANKLVIIKTAKELEAAAIPPAELAKLGAIDFRKHHVALLSQRVNSGPGLLWPVLHVTAEGEIAGGLYGILCEAVMPGVCWAAAVVPAISDLPPAPREDFRPVAPSLAPDKVMSGIHDPQRQRGLPELKSNDPTEVLLACLQLGEREDAGAVNALVDLYTATSAEPVRRTAGGNIEVDELTTVTNAQIRDGAAAALYRITRRNYKENPAAWRLWAQAQANQQPATPASVDELRAALRGHDPKVTLEAVKALGAMGPQAQAALGDLRQFRSHPSAAVREAAGAAVEAITRDAGKASR
jgi:hypothetical protein